MKNQVDVHVLAADDNNEQQGKIRGLCGHVNAPVLVCSRGVSVLTIITLHANWWEGPCPFGHHQYILTHRALKSTNLVTINFYGKMSEKVAVDLDEPVIPREVVIASSPGCNNIFAVENA
eukprot:6511116-Pyramimonas_sp.AAC.1